MGFAAVVAVAERSEIRTPAEFLEDFRREYPNLEATLDDLSGASCVRSRGVIEFTGRSGIHAPFGGLDVAVPRPNLKELTAIIGQFPPDSVSIWSGHGLLCSHPYWPQYLIELTYQQLYAKGQAGLSPDAEAATFFKSVVFTSTRPRPYLELRGRWDSNFKAGTTAYDEQRWSNAEASLQAALTPAEDLGPKNPFLAMTLAYLASTQARQNRLADAEALLRRLLDIVEAQPTVNTPSVEFNEMYGRVYGQTLNDLGWIHMNQARRAETSSATQSQLEEAERLLQRALAAREKAFGPDHIDVGQSAFNLMNLYRNWGRLTDAERLGRRALAIYERQEGADDPRVGGFLSRRIGEVLATLSHIYFAQGRLADAEPLFRRFFATVEKAAEENDLGLASDLETYATILRKLGREEEAREMEKRAQAIRAKVPKNR